MTLRAVPLSLGGTDWSLRCTLGSMAAVEDGGETWSALLEKLRGPQPSMRATQRLIWAMLQGSEHPPTMAQIGEWVDPHNFAEVLTAVGSALRAAFPESQEPEKGARPRGTGTRLSALPTARSPSTPIGSGV